MVATYHADEAAIMRANEEEAHFLGRQQVRFSGTSGFGRSTGGGSSGGVFMSFGGADSGQGFGSSALSHPSQGIERATLSARIQLRAEEKATRNQVR